MENQEGRAPMWTLELPGVCGGGGPGADQPPPSLPVILSSICPPVPPRLCLPTTEPGGHPPPSLKQGVPRPSS